MRHTPSLHFATVASAFKVSDIAEPLHTTAAPDWKVADVVASIIEAAGDNPGHEFALVRDNQKILGYIALDFVPDEPNEKFDGPAEGRARDHCIPITPDQIVPGNLPLLDLIPLFQEHFFFFVLTGNDLTHVISFIDLDSLPVKLCLFTLIMSLEAELVRVLSMEPKRTEQYLSLLPERRQLQARELAQQKYRKATITSYQVLLATNFVDKFTMLLRSPDLARRMPFPSKSKAEQFYSRLQDLRNRIAHSESILAALGNRKDFAAFLSQFNRLMRAVEAVTDGSS